MRAQQSRSKIQRLMGMGLAVSAMVSLTAGDALAAAAGPVGIGGGPRISAPSIGSVGPRGGNFRTGPSYDRVNGDKGNPDTGGRGPKGPKNPGIIVIPTGPSGPIPPQQSGSSGTPSARSITAAVPPAGELRYVPDEVIIEAQGNISQQAAIALAQRFNLTRTESQYFPITNSTIFRWKIPNASRSVPAVIRQVGADGRFLVSPNYLYTLSQTEMASAPANKPEGDPAQYTLGKLRLPLAHGLAKGDQVLVAVIDSGVDTTHPEFGGVIADTFDVLDPAEPPHAHGTAIAGAIAAHSRLMGVAPAAKILAIRAFGESKGGGEGTTFNIIKSVDWAMTKGAQIINMSFAG
ncbi:MAG: S8 family serine peptidase, partial [Pseudorhodoplanes sp.]